MFNPVLSILLLAYLMFDVLGALVAFLLIYCLFQLLRQVPIND